MGRLILVFVLVFFAACGDDDDSSSNETGNGRDAGQTRDAGDAHKDASKATTPEDAGSDASSKDAATATGVDCMTACDIMVKADCDNGPPSVQLCTVLCESITGGDNEECRTAFKDFLACLDPSVVATCNSDGDIMTSRCQAENEALGPCLP